MCFWQLHGVYDNRSTMCREVFNGQRMPIASMHAILFQHSAMTKGVQCWHEFNGIKLKLWRTYPDIPQVYC